MIQSDNGFTLIETLVALAFVSVMATGLATLMVVSAGLMRDAQDDSGAAATAIQKIEQLRGAIAAGVAVPLSPDTSLDTDVPGFSDRTATYVRRWQVASLPSATSSIFVLQVRVLSAGRPGDGANASNVFARLPGEVVLTTLSAPR